MMAFKGKSLDMQKWQVAMVLKLCGWTRKAIQNGPNSLIEFILLDWRLLEKGFF